MFLEESGDDMRTELGLTKERSNELVRITKSIVDSNAVNGAGRTSHVLLSISGRKDLNDTEKVICSFMFACQDMHKGFIREKPKTAMIDIGKEMNIGMDIGCVVVAPDGMERREIMTMTMAMLMSQLRDMPKPTMKDLCKNLSELFAKISETGEVKL